MFSVNRFNVTRRNFIFSSAAVAATAGCSGIKVSGNFLNSGCQAGKEEPWVPELRDRLTAMADHLTKGLKPWSVPNNIFDIREYGAVGDGETLNTVAIQAAIQACSQAGGGVVLVESGDYVTGTIDLQSGVMLEVAEGARILGSIELADYPPRVEALQSVMSDYYEFRYSLIYAERCNKVGIRGKGEIYFRGEKKNFSSPQTTGKIVGRPLGIRMVECENVVLQDIFLRSSASWMQNYVWCRNLIFDGIKVVNHANYNNDGLDPDGCENVIVRNCFINSEDDAMCLKGGSGKPTRNVLIENSTFITTCNAFKLGTDTQGGFEDILVRNVTLGGVPESEKSIAGNQASTGITLATVDGGDVRNIYIHDITINRARCPIFIRIGNRFRLLEQWPNPGIGDLERILIERVKGEDNFRQGSFLSGLQDKRIKDIVIRDVDLEMEGHENAVFAGLPVDENEGGYPDAHQFSVNGLPAYAFSIRHAGNVRLECIRVRTKPADVRPAFVTLSNTANIWADGKAVPAQELLDLSYEPRFIQNVRILDSNNKAEVSPYQVGSRVYHDRGTVILEVPEKFEGAELLRWAMNLRSSTAESLLEFDLDRPGTLYIAHHPLYTAQYWLKDGFEESGELRIDKWTYKLYSKEVDKPQRMVLGGNHTGELPVAKGCNYLVIFVGDEKP